MHLHLVLQSWRLPCNAASQTSRVRKVVGRAHKVTPWLVVVCRSARKWESIEVTVDMDSQVSALEVVAGEVVAAIKLRPHWYGGDYRVWFAESLPGFKLKIGIYFNYSDKGGHLESRLAQDLAALLHAARC